MNRLVSFVILVMSFGAVAAKQDIHILFLGSTGAGKSSLVNIFYNHVIGKSYDDPRAYVIPLLDGRVRHEVNIEKYKAYGVQLQEGGQSQTIEVREYIAENDYYIVHLWDAPGFNDTKGHVTDESHIQTIVSAIAKRSIHAIAVVLGEKETERVTLDVQNSISRVQNMLPKTASNNIVGIFTRVQPGMPKHKRDGLRPEFSRLMKIPSHQSNPNVYAVSGASFFNVNDDENIENMRAEWARDRSVIEKLLADVKGNVPISGETTRKIQDIIEQIESKISSRTADLLALDELRMTLKVLRAQLQNSLARQHENQDYEKERTVTVEVSDYVGGNWYALWLNGGAVKANKDVTTKFQDEEQFKRFTEAMSSAKTFEERIKLSQDEEKAYEDRAASVMEEVIELQKQRTAIAMSTEVDAFIRFSEKQINIWERNIELTPELRNERIAMLKKRIALYQKMRDIPAYSGDSVGSEL